MSQELGMLKGRTMDLLPGEIPEGPLQGQAEVPTHAAGCAESFAVSQIYFIGREGLQQSVSTWSTPLPSVSLMECDAHSQPSSQS